MLARFDDAPEHRRDLARALVAPAARDENRLRREECAERAEPVRPQGAPARDEVHDRVCEPEPRGDLDRARDAHELDVDSAVGHEALGEVRIHRRDAEPVEILERPCCRLGGNRCFERARAESQAQERVDADAALLHEIHARHTAVHDAVLHVLGNVGRADEHDVDRRVAAWERERTLTRLLGPEPGIVQQLDRGLAKASLGRDGDGQPARCGVLRARRSSTSR